MSNLMGIGYSCGINAKTKERAQKEIRKAFGDDDLDEPIVLTWRMDPRQSMSDWVSRHSFQFQIQCMDGPSVYILYFIHWIPYVNSFY